ncbi:MAG: MerR family transcriptional regulator [Lachnospiraceae bacterium]
MKMKAVCEITGLSDRTVRYYIEQNLISPAYTENYLGRKSFDFTKENVDELKDIAVLRKFNFTIQEIRDILLSPETSRQIVSDVQARARQSVCEGQTMLQALSVLDAEKVYTVSELAHILATPSQNQPLQNDAVPQSIPVILRKVLKSVLLFFATWMPWVGSVVAIVITLTKYEYPNFNFKVVVWMLIALLPSGFMLFLPKIKTDKKTVFKRILLVLCVASIPANFLIPMGMVTKSETTDIRNYRKFDAECLANQSRVFQAFFPLQAHYFENIKRPNGAWEAVYLDAEYCYRYWRVMDYTYDIYAEWPLEEQVFREEVERVRLLFERFRAEHTYYKYTEAETERHTCWILYTGNSPFQKATDNYNYVIFAFDESQNRVRYIYCDSLENGVDQPYYLELEW